MPPQRPQHQSRLVLLHRQLFVPVSVPAVPRRGQRPIGVVLVEQVSLVGDDAVAEVKEAPRHLRVASANQRGRHQRAVAWPHVGVGVAAELRYVEVVGGDDGSVVVNLGAQDEQTASVQIADRVGQIGEFLVLLGGPQRPIMAGALQKGRRALLAHGAVEARHLTEVLTHRYPVPASGLAVRRDVEVQRHGRIHAALSHRVARQVTIFGVAPGTFFTLRLFDAHRPLVHT